MTAVPPPVKDEVIKASSMLTGTILSRNQIEDIITDKPDNFPHLQEYNRSDRRRFISSVMNHEYPAFYESKKPKLPKWIVEADHAASF